MTRAEGRIRDAVTVRERPVVFSVAAVQATRAGRMPRFTRPVKNPGDFLGAGGKTTPDWDDPQHWGWEDPEDPGHFLVLGREGTDLATPLRCPFGEVGDHLWVRESWLVGFATGYTGVFTLVSARGRTDREGRVFYKADGSRDESAGRSHWRPAGAMPRRASRLTREITAIRVRRLREIREEEARAAGLRARDAPRGRRAGCAGENNPFVWAISYRVLAGGA